MKEADKVNEGASHHEAGYREALEMRLSRRSLLAGVAATAALSVIGVPAKSAASETPLQILTGPVTPMGTSAYDTTQLAQAAHFKTNNTVGDSFYDRALTYYMVYYRTGDPQWLATANAAAVVRADDTVANMVSGAANQSPRDFATLGMAIHYLLTGYANSRTAVRAQAKQAHQHQAYSGANPLFGDDARESAYCLMAFVATTLLGGDVDYSSDMTTSVNAFITFQGTDRSAGGVQSPHSGWQSYAPGMVAGDGFYILNYMNGLVMEALILYDRAVGDSRIVPALKSAVDWLWSTQWVPLGGGPTRPAATSTSAVTLGSGTRTFTTQAGLGYNTGDVIFAIPQGIWWHGTFTAGSAVVTGVDDTSLMQPGMRITNSGATVTDGITDVLSVDSASQITMTHPAVASATNVVSYMAASGNMYGTVTSYSGTTLTLNAFAVIGSLTLSNWQLIPSSYPIDQTAPGPGCIQYANINSGSVGSQSNAGITTLMGMQVPAWGYLYSRGQGATYKTNGDTILAALGAVSSTQFSLAKQFPEAFRSSPRYLGWTATTLLPPSGLVVK